VIRASNRVDSIYHAAERDTRDPIDGDRIAFRSTLRATSKTLAQPPSRRFIEEPWPFGTSAACPTPHFAPPHLATPRRFLTPRIAVPARVGGPPELAIAAMTRGDAAAGLPYVHRNRADSTRPSAQRVLVFRRLHATDRRNADVEYVEPVLKTVRAIGILAVPLPVTSVPQCRSYHRSSGSRIRGPRC
jgi:hypothetical protein